jgi:hypothetical protein
LTKLKHLVVALALQALVSGCTDLASASPLTNAYRSPEALAQAALAAVAAEDQETLAGLMITRHEYETLVWPSLPDREYTPFDFVWSVTGPRSRKARNEVVNDFAGLPLELVYVDLGDEREVYDSFVLHKEARMRVRRTDTGQEGDFPLMDVLVEMDGGWKFMNFREDT